MYNNNIIINVYTGLVRYYVLTLHCDYTNMYSNDEGSHSHACGNHDTADYECATLQPSLLSCLSLLNAVGRIVV